MGNKNVPTRTGMLDIAFFNSVKLSSWRAASLQNFVPTLLKHTYHVVFKSALMTWLAGSGLIRVASKLCRAEFETPDIGIPEPHTHTHVHTNIKIVNTKSGTELHV